MAVYRAAGEPEKKKKKKPVGCMIFLLLCLAAAAVAAWAAVSVTGEIGGKNAEPENEIVVSVQQGSGLSSVAAKLKAEGVIQYEQVFKLYAKGQEGVAQKLQYGDFKLYKGMSYDEILEKLTSQVVYVESVRLTFPEGSTALDIAGQMELAGLCTAEEFIDAADNGDFSQFRFWSQRGDNELKFFQCEGYLFPDTYDFAVDGTAYDHVETFYARFEEQMTDELYARMEEMGLSLSDTVTLASFIQEEAGNEEDEKVSAVFHNRLAEDSPFPRLESNASSYVQNPEDNNYLYNWIADYYGGFEQIPAEKYAAYNTYSCEGLPAGPISNPGIEAIKAALYPDEEFIADKYYFFVTDLTGKYYYGKTVAEHGKNVDIAFGVNATLGK
ncbi:MAG: endolytic transglycosylase MltG [Oscillospiraceae bacterium]|nr:endolytic transglycosylase MltG [Oscillospiraceae bacterium]